MRWPFVARSAYELALQQITALTERNDRLVEAVSRSGGDGKSEVMMPRRSEPLEFSPGWFDNRPVANQKEIKQ